MRRFRGSSPVLKEIVGVEDAVAKEVVDCSMKFIATALGSDANERPGAAAILRGIGIGAHPKFLDRIHRWPGHLRGQFLHVLRDRVVVDTIENKIILQ